MGNNRSCADGDIVTDREVGQDGCARPNQALCADGDTTAERCSGGDVAEFADVAVMVNGGMVVDDTACTDLGIRPDNAACGNQAT